MQALRKATIRTSERVPAKGMSGVKGSGIDKTVLGSEVFQGTNQVTVKFVIVVVSL